MKIDRKHAHQLVLMLITTAHIIGASGMVFAHERGGDFKHYQRFTEKLANGELDLSIIGFHGSDFVGALWYLLSGSGSSHLEFQMLCAFFIPITAYYAGKALFRSRWHGVLLASIIALMPYVVYSYITGYTQASNILFFLLTLVGAASQKWWTGITWAIAILTKPFAIILLPILLMLARRKSHSANGTDTSSLA